MEALMGFGKSAGTRPASGVHLVVVDAMFTLFQPKRRKRRRLLCEVYRDVAGLPSSVTDAKIWKTIIRERSSLSVLRELNDERFWRIVNTEVFRALLPDGPRRRHASHYGERAHDRVLTDPTLYVIDVNILRAVRFLRTRGIRVVIGSNARHGSLTALLQHFGVYGEFDGYFTSDQSSLGVRKPYPDFWLRIMNIEGVNMAHTLHIGNSPTSDTGAADVDIPVCLYDPRREHDSFLDGDLAELPTSKQRAQDVLEMVADGRVTICRNAREIRKWLQKHGALQARI